MYYFDFNLYWKLATSKIMKFTCETHLKVDSDLKVETFPQ